MRRRQSSESDRMLALLDGLIADLTWPLTDKMSADGWSEEARENALEHFTFLRTKFLHGEQPVDSDVGAGLSRWLDTYGVHSGHILSKVSELSVLMFNDIDNRRIEQLPRHGEPLVARWRRRRQQRQQLADLDKLVERLDAKRSTEPEPDYRDTAR